MKLVTKILFDGELALTLPQKIELSHYKDKTVTIELQERKRTPSQNAYLHVLFDYISAETGDSKEAIKTIEKRRHLTPKEIQAFNEKHLVLPSTTELTNPQMSEFIERVLADCSFLNIVVPTKEELGYGPK